MHPYHDSTANNNDSTAESVTSRSRSKIGNCPEFGGADTITIAENGTLDLASNLTIECWVYPDRNNTGEKWCGKRGAASGGYGLGHHLQKLRFTTFYVKDYDTVADYITSVGTWYHVVAVLDTSFDCSYYVDGTFKEKVTHTTGATLNDEPFRIGQAGSGVIYFDGRLDEVRISNTVRSSDYITATYNNQSSPSTFYALGSEQSTGWLTGWKYRKKITVDQAKVDEDLTDFPVLINFASDDDLAAYARNDGYDLRVTTWDGTTLCAYEREKFDGATGELVLWFKAPVLYASTDTVFYLYFGKSNASDGENAEGVWDTNFKGVWHLHDDLNDSTSNNNDGTNHGSVDIGGKIANGQDFEASDPDYIDVGSAASLRPGSFTIEAWINPETVGVEYFVSNLAGGYKGYGLALGNTDEVRVVFGNGSVWRDLWTVNSPVSSAGVWYHVVGVFDDANNQLLIYVDGLEKASASEAYSKSASTVPLVIGSYNGVTSNFDGIIDEVRISSIVRSAGWIKTCYNNQDNPGAFYTLASMEEGAVTQPYSFIM